MENTECNGKGFCLDQNFYLCSYDCKPIPCVNYSLCNNVLPEYILDFNCGTCWNCSAIFTSQTTDSPVLSFRDDVDCAICFETGKKGIKCLKCSHYVCQDCFQRIYCDQKEDEPVFPEQYDFDLYIEEPHLFDNNPEIQEWKKQTNILKKIKMENACQKRCPFCRK